MRTQAIIVLPAEKQNTNRHRANAEAIEKRTKALRFIMPYSMMEVPVKKLSAVQIEIKEVR
jgi:hypothetical protein